MATTDATTAAGLNGQPAASTQATKSLTQTYDQFMKLLTAQLKNQNPLDPMKPEAFTQQLVEFASVEQSIATNKNIEKLLSVQTGNQMAMAGSYIGLSVTSSADTNYSAGNGADYSYVMPLAAQTTTIQILNSSGQAVRTASGQIAVGTHNYAWDGKDDNGNALPKGEYKIVVTAVDSAGKSIDGITTSIKGIVTGVESAGGTIQLKIGTIGMPLDKVTNVGLL
jgi:flagellar basal-body rod modification protein FlgD